MNRIAVYPGTFDPVTFGHLDIIRRGVRLVDRLVVAVAVNTEKQFLFSSQERMDFLREAVDTIPGVEVCQMNGLLVDFVRQLGADFVLRGLRAVSDFEYEFQMAGMNRKLYPEVETVFLVSGEETLFLSSRLVKEIAGMGGDVSRFTPPGVIPELKRRMMARLGRGPG
ncbi:MAG: pantetheine-phosphate adenylyltransferase [Magnetococcales bacterium]|nr:pantetheine-phosphate adenylyltransferase [Magnetococcales bacterium]NGZ07420.1 pantetheine-phosphate adenylyltransferase [Magnetococcales bacterium]